MALKPVETLALIASDEGWDGAALALKQQRLEGELLHPHAQPGVLAVFAHGAEALRARELSPTRYVVETFIPARDAWLILKEHGDASAATSDACSWYPLPDKNSVIHQWDKARDRRIRDSTEMLRGPFPNRTALAEFWYDTKGLDWSENFGASPWGFAGNVASIMFNEPRGPDCSDAYQEVLRQGVRLIDSEWGYEALIASLVQRFLGNSYDFYQGELLHQGSPVIDGGFSRGMTDFEREVLFKSVAIAQEVYGGAVWDGLDASARGAFLEAQFTAVAADDQPDALKNVRESAWSALDAPKQNAVARHLGYWIEAGRVPSFQLPRIFGRMPLAAGGTRMPHGVLDFSKPIVAVDAYSVPRARTFSGLPVLSRAPQKTGGSSAYSGGPGLG